MKIPQLTFTRFLAALSIIIYHFAINLYPYNTDLLKFLVKQANIGVSFFYVLSGFVMIIAYANKSEINFIEYFKNRIARILPVYYLAIILNIWYYIEYDKVFLISDLLLNIFAIQAWVPTKVLSINYPGWSISVEMFFYICFPFLFNKIYTKIPRSKDNSEIISNQLKSDNTDKKSNITLFDNYYLSKTLQIGKNQKLTILLIFSIMFWFVTQYFFNYYTDDVKSAGFGTLYYDLLYYFPLMHVNQFILGNVTGLIYLIYFSDKKVKNDFWILGFVLLSLVSFGFNTILNPHNGLYSVAFIPFIIMLSINDGYIKKLFSLKVFELAGEVSYGMYILQVPVYLWSVVTLRYYKINDEYVLFYLPLQILIIFSTIMYFVYEKPMRNLIKHKSN